MAPQDDQPTDRPATRDDRATEPSFLEFLVCPVTKESLMYSRERNELISRRARLAYPIVDGIPLMAPDAARELNDDENF